MKVNVNDIFDFFETRLACHIKSVNYFASLLGYHFPEHDGDKIREPMRTGYAYVFYSAYHRNFYVSKKHADLHKDAKQIHHSHATHHIQYYKDVRDIPNICLYEMVSDWASANFERKYIMHRQNMPTIQEWFDTNLAQFDWKAEQQEILKKCFDIFDTKTDIDKVKAIWQPLVEKI